MNQASNGAKSIFLDALELQDDDQRNAFLAAKCAGNSNIREEVDRLMGMFGRLDSFMDSPTTDRSTNEQDVLERPGSLIGPYKLLEQIGEGGMGVVYVAEQTEPVRRRVALKIIKPGMDTKQVIGRFEAERQALAMMDHPHIAKVLDAGTTDAGRPYFVMELVRGLPVTEYCDKARLSPRQRLELFIDVCHAVQHAHQKGIIHRDLKPSNVMITVHDGRPVAKVIDFGVAKAVGQQLTERTVYTAHTQLVGTPLYMSPEQADFSSQDVDTRSDVYSLGVLLYELLTGQTPFDKETLTKASFDEMRRIIREDEPPCPSRRFSTLSAQTISTVSQHRGVDERHLGRVLRGELDWIVMKALEKDRSRRYESASALAADIQRYLSDEPVLACPPTAMYRFQKFARKHKPAIATAIAIAACLLLGTTVSAWQAVRATTAESHANANEQKAVANAATAQEKEQEAVKQRDEVKALNDKLVAKEQQLQRTLYAAHMNLARHALDADGAANARGLLAQHRPKPGETDLRGYEWYYLYLLCHADLLTMKADVGIFRLAYSSDGKRLAGASRDNTVTVWDAQTGQQLLYLQGGTLSVAFSPDGKRLASGNKVWDAQSGKQLLNLKGHTGYVRSVAFSPDSKRVASTGWVLEDGKSERSEAKIWDAETGREFLSLKGADGGVAFSPDGKRLASGNIVWDAQSGEELLSLKGLKGSVSNVAYSPDGTRIATASESDWTIKVWEAQTGRELLSLQGSDGRCVVFSPDGKRLASAGGARNAFVKVWDTQTGEELLSQTGHQWVYDVAFSPDGKHLATGSWDTEVKVWDIQRDPRPLTLKGSTAQFVASWAFSPDGKYLASGSVRGRPGTSPEGRTGKVWDAQTGPPLFSLQALVNAVAYSPDGKRLASAGDGQIKVWDGQTGQELLALKSSGRFVAFSPDGKRLASSGAMRQRIGGSDEVKVWDAQTGQELLTVNHTTAVHAVAFSPDGKRLAGQGRATLKVWDAETGQEILTIPAMEGHPEAPWYLAYSPDGKRLASGAGVVPRLWDAETGRELLALKGHINWVHNVVFSPDGKRLATASHDDTLKVWDAETGLELLSLPGGRNVAFSPDGHRLASYAGGTVTIYDATPLPEQP